MTQQQWKRNTGKLRTLGIVTTGAAAFSLGYGMYKHQNTFYRTFVMPAVRVLPAEAGHNLAVWALKHKIYPAVERKDDLNLHSLFYGKIISNPIGIAAGFDKNGEAIEGLHELGFGFVEIGTVTPGPQEGNPMPRVFRLENDRAIINRYGFNSEGHDKVLERVRAVKYNLNKKIVVGVNLGRNRHSANSAEDYVKGVGVFGPVADYLVINVSSPNTEGLRDLQRKNQLESLLESVNKARESLDSKFTKIPIFLKLSPDLELQDIKDVIKVISKSKHRVDGLIVSNTTTTRGKLKDLTLSVETGGLSGEPLRQRSTEMIALVYELTKGKVPIIGVGGISSGFDAYEKIEAGASYLQFYTALVYEGPAVVERMKKELTALLNEHGYANIRDAVGTNYKKYLPKKT